MTPLNKAVMEAGFAGGTDPAEVIRVLRETVGEREAQILDLEAWRDSALKVLAKSDVLREALSGHSEYLGWDIHDAAADLLQRSDKREDQIVEMRRQFVEYRDAPMERGPKLEVVTIRKTLNVVVSAIDRLLAEGRDTPPRNGEKV